MHKILIVDDEAGIRDSLAGILADEGYAASSLGSGEACLDLLRKTAFDVVLLDIWLPGIDGLEALGKVREFDNPPEVIMISGHGTIETAVRATKLGAYDFLEKPLSLDKTLILVKNAIESKKLRRENVDLRKQLYAKSVIAGDSIPMKALRQQIGLMAPTNGRVLIYGESGTGKELVAHAIHAQSLRQDETFVEVNCAAIPEDLIESELFGHYKGSFPGAAADKEGKFQKADGSPLFLDEVGDMSLKTQSKVLRTLEEQRFTRVGGDDAIEVLMRYSWPGNVRELRNVIERIVIMNPTTTRFDAKHLPPLVYREGSRRAPKTEFSTLHQARDAYERDYILKTLDQNHGNVSRTSELLGLERSHLYRKMKAMGIAAKE